MRIPVRLAAVLLLFFLSACQQTPPSHPTPPSATAQQELPSAASICSISTTGLTADDTAAFTAAELQTLFDALTPTRVPLSQEEYEQGAFLSGYLLIEFETDAGWYTVIADNAAEVYVIFRDADGATSYGQYRAEQEIFDALTAQLYD